MTKVKNRTKKLRKIFAQRKLSDKINKTSRITKKTKVVAGKKLKKKLRKMSKINSSTNEVSAPSPSTSREAIRATSTASPVTTTRQIKTFTKFKDDKFKTRTKKLFTQSNGKQMYFGCSPSQQISRKILRTIKRKMNLNSSKNHTLTKCRQTNRYSVCDLTVKEVAQNAEKSNATGDNGKDHDDDDDDDCVLIDAAPPEIILIDDESVAICDASDVENISDLNISNISHLGNNRNLVLRTYQPIGSASNYRRNQINFGETLHSTPKQILNDSTICPEPPCYIKTMSMIVEERSKRSKTRSGKAVDKSTPSSISITEPEDDSVIFVSEEMQKPAVIAADYISLATATEKYPISAQPREPREVRQLREPKEPRSKRVRHELFTSMEQKELQQYNDNAYNPNKDTPTTATPKRMVIVDGSNVAYHHALNKEFSVKGLQICLEYFEKLGHEVKAVVPQFRLQKLKSTNPIALEKLHEEGKIVLTPCKNLPGKSSSSYDDRFILQLAAELDAAIVSNDNYRDLIHENPAFKKIIENRVVGFSWCNDMFILPKDPYGKWGPALTTILNRS